jgi:hypothetical protein
MISMLSIVLGGLSTTRLILTLAVLESSPAYRSLVAGVLVKRWTAVRLAGGLLAIRWPQTGLKVSSGILECYRPCARGRWRRWRKRNRTCVFNKDRADSLLIWA